MDQQALQELIALFLKINPQPSDQQFHALAEACGVDKETLESISYGMLSDAEDLLDDPDDLMMATVEATMVTAGCRCIAGAHAEGCTSTTVSNEEPLQVEEASAPSTSVDYGDDGEEGGSTHTCDDPVIPLAVVTAIAKRMHVMAAHGFKVDAESPSQVVLEDPTVDPDDMSLQDVALNDGDPTDDDLGMQEETLDDGFTVDDAGAGLVNNVSDALTDDGVPDVTLP